MKVLKINDMKGGWFVGNFKPTAFTSPDFEVCYKLHKAGEEWPVHYHKEATEINFLVRGRMRIQDTILKAGDIFVLEPFEVADPEFFEDCEVVIVKTPSVPGDKYIVENSLKETATSNP